MDDGTENGVLGLLESKPESCWRLRCPEGVDHQGGGPPHGQTWLARRLQGLLWRLDILTNAIALAESWSVGCFGCSS